MIYKCKMCGGSLEISSEDKICTCEYCGTSQSVPNLEDKKISKLFERGNDLIRNNEFDNAIEKFEEILINRNDDPEVYWSLLMAKFGVTYEKDPYSGKMIPTIHRSQDTSIFLEEDYELTLKYADESQKEYYEKTARQIDNIQKKFNVICENEEPFDIFICYKQRDDKTKKETEDFKIAYELYNSLSKQGYRVFFSHVTLEDLVGEEYEPYIYAALKSSRVMLSIGTKKEYYNAVWVKNEWRRFMYMIKDNHTKRIIPICPNTKVLPDEFNKFQAVQYEGNIVWQEDLVRNINKLFSTDIGFTQEFTVKDKQIDISDIDIDFKDEVEEKIVENNDEHNKKFTTIIAVVVAAIVIIVFFSILTNNATKTNKENSIDQDIINELDRHEFIGEDIYTAISQIQDIYDMYGLGVAKVEIKETASGLYSYDTVLNIEPSNYKELIAKHEDVTIILDYSAAVNRRMANCEIRIRPSASTSGSILGHVYKGDVFDIYDTQYNEGYTWYKIAEGQWIADDGTWTVPVEDNNYSYNNDVSNNNLNYEYNTVNENVVQALTIQEDELKITAENFWDNIDIYASEIDIPYGVTTIPVNGFSSCKNLQYINIPESVTTIEHSAFSGCESLKEVFLPNSVTVIPWSCFYECYNLEYVYIPNSITEIEKCAFYGCKSLSYLEIPSNCARISGGYNFCNCDSLSEVFVPSTVTSISKYAFSFCDFVIYTDASSDLPGWEKYWNYDENKKTHREVIYNS